jgi:hypothetical protein
VRARVAEQVGRDTEQVLGDEFDQLVGRNGLLRGHALDRGERRLHAFERLGIEDGRPKSARCVRNSASTSSITQARSAPGSLRRRPGAARCSAGSPLTCSPAALQFLDEAQCVGRHGVSIVEIACGNRCDRPLTSMCRA